MKVTDRDRERFWSRVDVREPDECWPWDAGKTSAGYGAMLVSGVSVLAHRVAFFLENGSWPEPCGLHTCDHPWCVNPRNIVAGTQGDNMRDMVAKGRFVPPGLSGENHPRARLTERDVQIIRLLCGRIGLGAAEVAARYGVSRGAIEAVVSRATWSRVPDLDLAV
jgi:hypothetical protein